MRSMKRYLCLALALVVALSLVLTGCGDKKDPAGPSGDGGTTTPTDTPKFKDTVELTFTLVGDKQD